MTAPSTLTASELALHSEKRALLSRLAEIERLETRHPALSDRRIAELREDRTGITIKQGHGETDPAHWTEVMSALDELASWRRHKLSDAEKSALVVLVDSVCDEPKHKAAVEAVRRIVPQKGRTT